MIGAEDFQRLDFWLWCARFRRGRAECAALVEQGAVRINRQPTEKPHAKVRIGDVLTLAIGGRVLVLRIMALPPRRGSAEEAQAAYEEIP